MRSPDRYLPHRDLVQATVAAHGQRYVPSEEIVSRTLAVRRPERRFRMPQPRVDPRPRSRARTLAGSITALGLAFPAVAAAMAAQIMLLGGLAAMYHAASPGIDAGARRASGARDVVERLTFASAPGFGGAAGARAMYDGSDSTAILMEGPNSEMRDAARTRVDAAAQELLALPQMRLVITGEAATGATASTGESLGAADAAEVRYRLVAAGVQRSRLVVELDGTQHPQCAAEDFACRSARRLVRLHMRTGGD